jgi:hypothetical protein
MTAAEDRKLILPVDDAPVNILKACYREEIIRELEALGLASLEIGECGIEFEF